jgi:hypothetical protein
VTREENDMPIPGSASARQNHITAFQVWLAQMLGEYDEDTNLHAAFRAADEALDDAYELLFEED